MIPDYIKKHKPPGSEIRHKNGHYYVYAVKGVYDRETKKSKSISQGCIGQIYQNVGFVPNEKNAPAVEMSTYEYGATRIIMATSEDLMELLRECFPSDFLRIYTLAVLKVLSNVSMKDIDTAYDKSAICRILPEVHLSRNTLATFLKKLSLNRDGMLKYMRGFHHFTGDSILFDGSSFISQFKFNPFVEKGYSPGNMGKEQIRLLYAFNKTTRFPIYFHVSPENITDMILFTESAREIGINNCVVIFDNGFYCKNNIDYVIDSEVEFIVPLKRNTKEVPEEAKMFSFYDKVRMQYFSYNKRIIYYSEHPSKSHNGCRVHVFYDSGRHNYLQNNYLDGKESKEDLEQKIRKTESFGVTLLLNNRNASVEDIYRDYKSRWEIESMFDTHKNTMGFKMEYEADYATQEAWAFIEFIALQMFYKIDGILLNNDLVKSMNVASLLFTASRITQAKIGDKWFICNVTKKDRELYSKLGVDLIPLS